MTGSLRVPRREWPLLLPMLVAVGLLIAAMLTGDSTTTSTTSNGLLVLEEIEGAGFLLFAGAFLVGGFAMLSRIFGTGIIRSTLILLVLGLGAIGIAVLILFTTPRLSTVTVDNPTGNITVVDDYVFRTVTNQIDLDQVLRVHYHYIPPRGEDRASAIISLILDDASSVDIHRGQPDVMGEWARAIAAHTGFPITSD